VLEPDGPPGGFLHRFVERDGPGVHHVTFKVPDITTAAAAATAFGYDVVGYDDRNPGWQEMFLHPRQAQGIVVQLAHAVPELDETTLGPDGPFPTFEGEPAEPAEIVCLRLRAESEQAAHRQWGELLGGERVDDGHGIAFAWKGSPMLIAVSIDASAEPGPVAIEVDGGEAVSTIGDGIESLGTRFVRARS
jgi:methylmalonyl-CoA/ethylmalonyl-CoA epimerase